MDKIKDLIKKRSLIKIPSDKEKIKSSIKIAEAKIDSAKILSQHEFYSESIVNSYTSIFHTCRALLYKDGIQEKSHYATYIYIKEKYEELFSKELITSFHHYQINRHKILYGLIESEESKEESKDVIEVAELFLKKAREFLNI